METTVKDVVKESFWIMPATPNFIDNGIPYITSKNIKMGKLDFSKVQYISQNDYDEISKNRPIIVNDLLISMIGTLGNIAIVKECDIPFYGQNMFLLRLNPDIVDLRYFYNYFNSDTINSYLQSKKNKSTQGYLKANHIDGLKIPIVSLEEQRRIADELDKTTDLINKRKEQLIKLDELVKARFVELFGDPKTNTNGYEQVKLSEIATYFNGLTYKPENVAEVGTIVLRSSNIQNSQLDFADTVRVDCTVKEKLIVQENDILMCSRNGSARLVGKVALIKEIQEPMTFGAFMMIIRSRYHSYLMTYFQMDAFRQQIKTGATTTINQITGRMLDEVTIPLPPMELVEQFAAFVKQTDKSKSEVQKSLEKLELLKKALMQKYFG